MQAFDLASPDSSETCFWTRSANHQRSTAATNQANGGAGRDRTDDLKLAKLPLSQLSYGPMLRLAGARRPGGPQARRHAAMVFASAARRMSHKDGGPGKTRTSDLTLIKRAL